MRGVADGSSGVDYGLGGHFVVCGGVEGWLGEGDGHGGYGQGRLL